MDISDPDRRPAKENRSFHIFVIDSLGLLQSTCSCPSCHVRELPGSISNIMMKLWLSPKVLGMSGNRLDIRRDKVYLNLMRRTLCP